MSVGQEFWIVATKCTGGESHQVLSNLKSKSSLNGGKRNGEDGPWNFNVPSGERSLLFGSFDNLIKLTDDLAKYDASVDSILHRLERQYLEIEPKAEFKVQSQHKTYTFLQYLSNWQWDEAKYPKTRSILDNTGLLMMSVNKLDEEARNKTAQYNEMKTQRGNLAKKEGANLMGKDLVDVLTPEVVKMNGTPDDDFIYTEHLTTVVVILARGSEKEFLQVYETKFCNNVVPMSAKKFKDMDDKDGNQLWRVVLFKSDVEAFKKGCREHRFVARDFEYSEDGYKKLKVQRAEIANQVTRQHEIVRALYQAAWSDVMVAWIHIKAMRVFVESVLRFGMPPEFAAYTIVPKGNATVTARKDLASILCKGAQSGPGDAKGDADDGEEYFPYVSLSFVPFNVQRS